MSDTGKIFHIVGNDISDGYHTFDELYAHRIELWLTVCRLFSAERTDDVVWRSVLHHNGSRYEGWFILGIYCNHGEQMSYHLPISRWDDADFAEILDRTPEWDGHTPADVLERLKTL